MLNSTEDKYEINLDFKTEYLDKNLKNNFLKHLKGDIFKSIKVYNEFELNPYYINYLRNNYNSDEFFHTFPLYCKKPFINGYNDFCSILKTKFIHNIFQILLQVEIKGPHYISKKIFKQIGYSHEIKIHKYKYENLDIIQKIFPIGLEISFDKQFITYGDKRIYIKEINYFINGDQYTLDKLNEYKIKINNSTYIINENSEYLEIGFENAQFDIPPNILYNIDNNHNYFSGIIIKFENYFRDDKNNFLYDSNEISLKNTTCVVSIDTSIQLPLHIQRGKWTKDMSVLEYCDFISVDLDKWVSDVCNSLIGEYNKYNLDPNINPDNDEILKCEEHFNNNKKIKTK